MHGLETSRAASNNAPPPPPILYKYTTTSTALLVLGNGTLRFCSPTTYNDPFDTQWDLFWQISTPEAMMAERDAIRKAITDPTDWPTCGQSQHLDVVREYHIRVSGAIDHQAELACCIEKCCDDGGCDKVNFENQQYLISTLRILCLSDRCDDILMWSHYADEHKGVTLGFNTNALRLCGDKQIRPVQYQQCLPHVFSDLTGWIRNRVYGLRTAPEAIDWHIYTHTKHAQWAYEHEWRSAWCDKESKSDFYDYKFPPDSLDEIIIGCNCDPGFEASVVCLAKQRYPNARIYRMSRHRHEFALQPTPISD